MAKETKKQIVARTRNDVAREYKNQIEWLHERIDALSKLYKEEEKKRIEYQEKAEKLEEELNKYKDWNERLQSFMNMSEDDRKAAMEKYRTESILNGKIESMLNIFSNIYRQY